MKDWQRDPEEIKTEMVQYWKRGVMLFARMSREAAQMLVKNGQAFVISCRAIGAVTNGEMDS